MSEETYAEWRRELRTVEDRLHTRLQALDERVHQRIDSHELHGTQAIAGVFSRSTTQVNFILGLLVTVLGGGLLTIYLGSRAYVDESLNRARSELKSSVTTSLDDFKRNLANELTKCLDQKPESVDVRGCLERTLGQQIPKTP